MAPSLYVASKTIHAARWRDLRTKGIPVIATWIDEAGPGESSDLRDLALRCIAEAAQASATLFYCEPGETAKGSLVEVGAALAANRYVVSVGTCKNFPTTFTRHPLWRVEKTIPDALVTLEHLVGFLRLSDLP
jgi:hypothetical protein